MRFIVRATITLGVCGLLGLTACDKGAPPAEPGEPAKAAEPGEPAKAAEPGEPAKADAVADAAAAKAKDLLAKSEAGKQLGDLAAKGEQLKASLEDKAPPLTPERYEQLVLGLSACELKNNSIDNQCPAYQELQKARQNKSALLKDLAGMNSQIGRKHLGHESASVRHYAVGMMGSAFAGGVAAEDVKAIIAAGKQEKDPAVLHQMIETIGSNQLKQPEVGAFILGALKHAQPSIRSLALRQLAVWGKKTKGALPAFQAVLQKEKDPAVRIQACEQAGELGEEKLLPLLFKLANDKKTDPELYAACFKGVVNLWTKYPFPPEKPSAKAYQATLKLLAAKPRSDKRPPWGLSSTFSGLKKPKPEWQAKAKFYKPAAFYQALAGVVTDPQANWMARTGFVDLLRELGAPRALFDKMRKAYQKPAGDDSHVVKKLDAILAKVD